MQRAGIQQRGANGSVQFEKNGGSISPTKPDGSRTLTSGYGSGSVSPLAASPRVKKFDGMSPEQFGKSAAARQGRGNAFTRSASPAATAMGPAQKALADFNAANPNVRTQSEIDGIGAKYQINRDKLTTIQAQKQVANHAAQSAAMRVKEAAAPPLTAAENLAEQIRPGILNENRARAAGPPRAVSPGSPPLANATGQTGNLLTKLTMPRPSLAPLLSSSTPPPLSPLRPPTPSWESLPTGIGARAAGGPVQGGQPYLVGEQGPEIVVPAQNGTVIPNKAISPSRLGRDKAMAYPPAGYPDHGLAPAAGQVRHRPMATNNDWRSPTRPVKASRPSLLASR